MAVCFQTTIENDCLPFEPHVGGIMAVSIAQLASNLCLEQTA